MDDFSAHVHHSQHGENKGVHLPEWEDPAADTRKQAAQGVNSDKMVPFRQFPRTVSWSLMNKWKKSGHKLRRRDFFFFFVFSSFMASNSRGRTGPERRKRAE